MSINEVWKHIIDNQQINLNEEYQIIDTNQIKNSKETFSGKSNQFEPRLLCKFDNSESRPEIFKDNNLYIISISNGPPAKYALVKKNIYKKLNLFYQPENKILKKNNSLVLVMGESEMSMLDNLRYNGIFEDIIGEQILYGPLLGGRHRCTFKTTLDNLELDIKGSQFETDGCFETENTICIIEAKSNKCEDFNIRQLYYPYRYIYDKIESSKKIIYLFIYKDKKKIIHIYKYNWINPQNMLSIKCTGYYNYTY